MPLPTSADCAAVTLNPIGVARTPYGDKFAVPRQGGLTPLVHGRLEFFPPYCTPRAFEGLEDFSHIYVLFLCSLIGPQSFKATARPPRLGGNVRKGIFATRTPQRPSRLGLSVLKLTGIVNSGRKVALEVEAPDLVDGTPVLDIKPYIPFCDSVPDALSGFAPRPPESLEVICSEPVRQDLTARLGPKDFAALLQILACDPRPAYHRDERLYTALLYGLHVAFQVRGQVLEVLAARSAGDSPGGANVAWPAVCGHDHDAGTASGSEVTDDIQS